MTTAIALFTITAFLLILAAVYFLATMRANHIHQQADSARKDAEILRLREKVEDLQKGEMRRYSPMETEYIENQAAIFNRALYENRTGYELIAEAIQRMGVCDELLIKGREQAREMRQKPNGK